MNFEKEFLKKIAYYETEGLIDSSSRKRLENYLECEIQKKSDTSWNIGLYLIYGLAGALIALGCVLAIAYNWDCFSKLQRLAIGFIPLIVSAIAGLATLPKLRESGWIEIPATLNIAGVICAISVVSQVYQINGDIHEFSFSVLLLTFLLPLVFNSSAALLGNLFLFVIWAGASFQEFEKNIFFVFTIILSVQIFFKYFSGRAKFIDYITLIVFCATVPIYLTAHFKLNFFHSNFAVLGMIYCCFILADYLYGNSKFSVKIMRYPMRAFGFAGILIIGLLVASWGWSGEGDAFFKNNLSKIMQIEIIAILLVLTLLYLFLFTKVCLKDKKLSPYLALCLYGFFCIFMFFSRSGIFGENCKVVLEIFSFAILIFASLIFILRGMNTGDFIILNAGTLIIISQTWIYFVESDMSMLTKSAVFIGIGFGLIALNVALAKKRKISVLERKSA